MKPEYHYKSFDLNLITHIHVFLHRTLYVLGFVYTLTNIEISADIRYKHVSGKLCAWYVLLLEDIVTKVAYSHKILTSKGFCYWQHTFNIFNIHTLNNIPLHIRSSLNVKLFKTHSKRFYSTFSWLSTAFLFSFFWVRDFFVFFG